MYRQCKDINEVMEGIQTMVVRGDPEAETHMGMVTPMMRAARKYFLERKERSEEDFRSEEKKVIAKKCNKQRESHEEADDNAAKIMKNPNTYRKNQAYFIPNSYFSDFQMGVDLQPDEL